MKRTLKVIKTEDGSSTIYIPELNETYHSFHGAVTESEYVFIKMGLTHFLESNNPPTISILEVGMGTGLNVMLTAISAGTKKLNVSFTTLEPYPIPNEIIDQLRFPMLDRSEENKSLFEMIHDCEWSSPIKLRPAFGFLKLKKKLEDYSSDELVDIVYFDAFAPNKQAELWTEQALLKVKDCMTPGGILVTYCAQGQFKRNLKSLGFEVESLPGPPGKMEMVRAQFV